MDTLLALFARRRPDAQTVLVRTDDGATMTYGGADRLSARLANHLQTLGARPGDRIAVQIERSPFAIALYLACLRAGLVYLPMNTAYTDAEVDLLVTDAEPTVLVVDPGRTRSPHGPVVVTADATGRGTLAEGAEGAPSTFDDADVHPDDIAVMLYTSGTTGRPKGAMLRHSNLASNAATLHAAWGFGPDDVLLHALPLYHAHGLFVALHCVLANGTGMVLLPRFDVDLVLHHLPAATVFMGVPTFYARLLADPRFDAATCRSVRLFVSGSAPLPSATHEEIERRTGHRVLERYGMTETTMITSNPLDGPRRAGTVGPPLPGVEVRVVDSELGTALPADTTGAVEVRGPNVFAGYWRRPELAATEWTSDGWFKTGDLGRLDDDGYLRLVGRSKDLIISGGLNVYPAEVEAVLDHLDDIVESAVVGLADTDLGEVVVAVVVARQGATVDADAVRNACRVRLAGFKVPKQVHVVDALPRNAMGKVEKARLRAEVAPPSGD